MNAERELHQRQLGLVNERPFKVPNRIVRYFPNTFMGNGHHGLGLIATKNGVPLHSLSPGEFLIFVNKKRTALKLLTCGGMVAHLKVPESNPIDVRTIGLLPRFFNGSEINYSGALKEIIAKDLSR